MGQIAAKGPLGGEASPGHTFALGTEVYCWQVNFLTPGSPFSSGEGAWPKPLLLKCTSGGAEPLGVSPPKAVDLLLIKFGTTGPPPRLRRRTGTLRVCGVCDFVVCMSHGNAPPPGPTLRPPCRGPQRHRRKAPAREATGHDRPAALGARFDGQAGGPGI